MAKIHIKQLEKLSNLKPTEEFEKKLEEQLEATLEHVERLSEIDTSKTPETNEVTDLKNVMRDDIATPSLPQDKVLLNAKKTYNGFFIVPGVLAEE